MWRLQRAACDFKASEDAFSFLWCNCCSIRVLKTSSSLRCQLTKGEVRRGAVGLLAHTLAGHLLPPESSSGCVSLTRCHSGTHPEGELGWRGAGGGGASSFTMFQWDVMRPSVCPHCIYNDCSSVRIDALGFNSLTAGVTSCRYFDGECEQLLCHSRAPGCCQGPFFFVFFKGLQNKIDVCRCRIFENEHSSSAGSSNWIYLLRCSLSVLFQFNRTHKSIHLTGPIRTRFIGTTRTEFSYFFIAKRCIQMKIPVLKVL